MTFSFIDERYYIEYTLRNIKDFTPINQLSSIATCLIVLPKIKKVSVL